MGYDAHPAEYGGCDRGRSGAHGARLCRGAIEAGRIAFEAGLMQMRDMAVPSTPVAGTPFFDLDKPK